VSAGSISGRDQNLAEPATIAFQANISVVSASDANVRIRIRGRNFVAPT
jgi:hypothetical protein